MDWALWRKCGLNLINIKTVSEVQLEASWGLQKIDNEFQIKSNHLRIIALALWLRCALEVLVLHISGRKGSRSARFHVPQLCAAFGFPYVLTHFALGECHETVVYCKCFWISFCTLCTEIVLRLTGKCWICAVCEKETSCLAGASSWLSHNTGLFPISPFCSGRSAARSWGYSRFRKEGCCAVRPS